MYKLDFFSSLILSFRLRRFQVSSDGCVTDLNSQLQLKTFELERVGLLYDETVQSLRKSEREKEQLREKLDVRHKIIQIL